MLCFATSEEDELQIRCHSKTGIPKICTLLPFFWHPTPIFLIIARYLRVCSGTLDSSLRRHGVLLSSLTRYRALYISLYRYVEYMVPITPALIER